MSSTYPVVCPTCRGPKNPKRSSCMKCKKRSLPRTATATDPTTVSRQQQRADDDVVLIGISRAARAFTSSSRSATDPGRGGGRSPPSLQSRSAAAARSLSRVFQQPNMATSRPSVTRSNTAGRENDDIEVSQSNYSSCDSSTTEEVDKEDAMESDEEVKVMGVSSLDAVLEVKRKTAEEKGEVVEVPSDTEDVKPLASSKPKKITVDRQGHEILWIDDDDDDDGDADDGDENSVLPIAEVNGGRFLCSECAKTIEKAGLCASCTKEFAAASKAMDELDAQSLRGEGIPEFGFSTTRAINEEGEDSTHRTQATRRTEGNDPTHPASTVSDHRDSECAFPPCGDMFDADTEESDEERERTSSRGDGEIDTRETNSYAYDRRRRTLPSPCWDPLNLPSPKRVKTKDDPPSGCARTDNRGAGRSTAAITRACLMCDCNDTMQGRLLCADCADDDNDGQNEVSDRGLRLYDPSDEWY